ncbi:MAG: NAD-binding protein [Desulfonatronovibrionaceae bacterium]
MRVLLCGLSRISRQLLEFLVEGWEVTVIDIDPGALEKAEHDSVREKVLGDASSPVVLDRAGLSGFDYVLAMTGSDDANLAIMRFAREKDVDHPLALVNSHRRISEFSRLGVRTVSSSGILAKSVYHYLQDPRIKVMPLDLGRADLMEMDVSNYFPVAGKSIKELNQDNWRVVGMFKGEDLVFPDENTPVQPSDRLIILGREGLFSEVCDLAECGSPQFPHNSGRSLLLALDPDVGAGLVVQEANEFVKGVQLGQVDVLFDKGQAENSKLLKRWSEEMPLNYLPRGKDYMAALGKIAAAHLPAVVMLPAPAPSIWRYLGRNNYLSLVQETKRPVLFSRGTFPYERILVFFSHCTDPEHVLHAAVDLGKQFGARVTALVVREKEIISGGGKDGPDEAMLAEIREQAHILKFEIQEEVRQGNPVKQAMAAAADYDLMVLGESGRPEGLFLYPNISELVASRCGCSVLFLPGGES